MYLGVPWGTPKAWMSYESSQVPKMSQLFRAQFPSRDTGRMTQVLIGAENATR